LHVVESGAGAAAGPDAGQSFSREDALRDAVAVWFRRDDALESVSKVMQHARCGGQGA